MSTQCWAPKRNEPDPQSIIVYTNAFPCENSNNASCCRAGDKCLDGNICQYGTPQPDGRLLYVAGCTDSNFKDPSCNRHCFDSAWPEITYLNASTSYACCLGLMGSAAPDCSQPTNETWQLPPPGDIKTLVSIPATPSAGWEPAAAATTSSAPSSATSGSGAGKAASATAALPASSPPTSTSATPSSDNDSSGGGGLDTGAKVGIGIGVGIGVPLLALLAAILFVLVRRRRRAASPSAPPPFAPADMPEKSPQAMVSPDYYSPGKKPFMPAEAPAYSSSGWHSEMPAEQLDMREVHGQSALSELPADHARR